MAIDCAYSLNQLYVVEGGPLPGIEDISEETTLKAMQWLITNCEATNGTLKVNLLNLSVVQFATLSVTCPALSPLRKNLNGFRRLLEVCMKRFTDPASITSINAQLVTKFTDAVNTKAVLSYPYHAGLVRRELDPAHKDFQHCIQNMH